MNHPEEEMYKKATILKVAARINGIRQVDPVEGIGTLIKENVDGLYLINRAGTQAVPNEFTLYKNITTKLVLNPDSYFTLRNIKGEYYLFSDFVPQPLIQVRFTRRPKYYEKTTSAGTPMREVGQAMGLDCLAIAVQRRCSYFAQGKPCKYCNISPTNVSSGLPQSSDLRDIGELVEFAGKNFKFFALTGGTFEDTDQECVAYTRMGNVIRENLGKEKYSGPFSLTPPKNLDLLASLHETGVDVISFNIDVWEDDALKRICPGKFEIGKKHYEQALLEGKRLWGEGNSVVQFLAGPWESNQSLLDASKHFLDMGILPNITSYFPSPRSPMAIKGRPKTLKEILDLYIEYGHLVRASGLYPNQRNSILTSPSGNRSSISNEAARGYVTKDNFEPERDLMFAGEFHG